MKKLLILAVILTGCGKSGSNGDKGVNGGIGPIGDTGPSGVVYSEKESCTANFAGIVFNKQVVTSSDGNTKAITCSVSTNSGQNSNSVILAASETAFLAETCTVVADISGPASGGSWNMSNATAVYSDVGDTANGLTVTLSCTSESL